MYRSEPAVRTVTNEAVRQLASDKFAPASWCAQLITRLLERGESGVIRDTPWGQALHLSILKSELGISNLLRRTFKLKFTSRFSLDADKLYEAVKEWRLFTRTDGTYYYQGNPLIKLVKIIDLLGVDEGRSFIELLARHYARVGGCQLSDLVAIKVLLERIEAKAELIVTGAEFKSSLRNPFGIFSGLYTRTGVDPAEVREITLAPKSTDSLRAMIMANRLACAELPKATISMEPTTLAVIHRARETRKPRTLVLGGIGARASYRWLSILSIWSRM